MRRRQKGSEGQATVEMALVLPILIWLLVGLVDVARMVSAVLIVQHASREAIRLGITGATDTQVAARALTMAATLDTTRLTVTVAPAGVRTTGSDMSVTVSYSYKVMSLMTFIGTDVPLSAKLVARVE